MCENATSGLDLTNKFRKNKLSNIKRDGTIIIMTKKILPLIKNYFNIIEIDHFCSTYFFISRIVSMVATKR